MLRLHEAGLTVTYDWNLDKNVYVTVRKAKVDDLGVCKFFGLTKTG